jgi:4-amino-4-deoxy-L-arabinose transferase-like glycosyltransferase
MQTAGRPEAIVNAVRIPLIATVLVVLVRALASALMPLTGDEAYYWEWSRQLAFGYADHPPMVAYGIAAFSWLGHTPLAVRAASLLWGLVAAYAAFDFVAVASRDRVAAAWAAFAVTTVPLAQLTFGFATPDAPYLAAWACSLALAQRALLSDKRGWWIALGFALAAALLSRIMAIALFVGIAGLCGWEVARKRVAIGGPALAIVVALVLYVPFLVWNASHHWVTFAFAVAGRHHIVTFNIGHVLAYAVFVAIACWFGATILVFRLFRVREAGPWLRIAYVTALPLLALLLILSAFESVEVYWAAGAALSLLLAAIVATRLSTGRVTKLIPATLIPSAVISFFALFLLTLPVTTLTHVATTIDPRVHLESAFEPFAYQDLVADLQRTFSPRAVLLTDGYGFSSVLDFYGGFAPHVIGYNSEGAQTRFWQNDVGDRAIFLDKVPLSQRPDFNANLHRACEHVMLYPPLAYRVNGTMIHTFYPIGCTGLNPARLAELDKPSR